MTIIAPNPHPSIAHSPWNKGHLIGPKLPLPEPGAPLASNLHPPQRHASAHRHRQVEHPMKGYHRLLPSKGHYPPAGR